MLRPGSETVHGCCAALSCSAVPDHWHSLQAWHRSPLISTNSSALAKHGRQIHISGELTLCMWTRLCQAGM